VIILLVDRLESENKKLLENIKLIKAKEEACIKTEAVEIWIEMGFNF
jgi:hypothetical protein